MSDTSAPTAAMPEEQTSYLHSLRSYASQSVSVTIHQAVLERWSRCAEAQKAEIDRLTKERDASRERERKLREAGQPVADAFRKHRTAMDAINALNEVGGDTGASIDGLWREADAASEEIDRAMEQFCAALQQQAADGR